MVSADIADLLVQWPRVYAVLAPLSVDGLAEFVARLAAQLAWGTAELADQGGGEGAL
jgi:hypothetical protein